MGYPPTTTASLFKPNLSRIQVEELQHLLFLPLPLKITILTTEEHSSTSVICQKSLHRQWQLQFLVIIGQWKS